MRRDIPRICEIKSLPRIKKIYNTSLEIQDYYFPVLFPFNIFLLVLSICLAYSYIQGRKKGEMRKMDEFCL
jgi:hypothetical protein